MCVPDLDGLLVWMPLQGKEKWTVDMVKDLGGKLNYFGYSESLFGR